MSESTGLPRLALVIPTYNESEFLRKCVASVKDTKLAEVIPVVVNAGDPLPEDLAATVVELQVSSDHFWTACIGVGLFYARQNGFDWAMLANSDNEFLPGTVDLLLTEAERQPGAVICSPIYDLQEDGSLTLFCSREVMVPFLLHNYTAKDWNGPEDAPTEPYPVEMTGGQGVLIPRSVFVWLTVDPKRFPHNRGDMDMWLSVRQRGVPIILTPRAGAINTRPMSTSGMSGLEQLKKVGYLFGSTVTKDSWRVIWGIRRKHQPLPVAIASFLIYTPLIWIWRIVRMAFKPA